MNTQVKEKIDEPIDVVVNEEQDGSATVELPENLAPIPNDDDDHPNDTADERLAKKTKRREKREIAKATTSEKEIRLELLRKENEEMKARLAVVEKKTHVADIARIDHALTQVDEKAQFAKIKMSEAMRAGDGDAFNAAQEMWDEARTAQRDLKALKESQIRPSQNNSIPDPMLQRQANDWMERNSWFNPNGNDSDSRIAKVIDEDLVKEGWNPKSSEYWEELDNRLHKYLPHRYNDDMDVKPSARRPRSVVTSSGRESTNGSSNRTTFTLSPEQVRAIKDAGMWDDPTKRAKMVQRYAQHARNNSY
jgi:hypothetical protein